MSKQIKVVINKKTGSISIETIGYHGKGCIEESKILKDLLGETEIEKLTPSYFETEKVHIKKHLPICG